jgi:ERCC4-type nuclease
LLVLHFPLLRIVWSEGPATTVQIMCDLKKVLHHKNLALSFVLVLLHE